MPNIKSMKKDLKRNAKKHDRNTETKTALKTFIKKARLAIGTDASSEAVSMAAKKLDKAAERGIIHKNQAARRKSRVMKAAAKAAKA
ncbi:MAG: 30S ribosomal protein S20 [Armatimonadota bacterium]|nr:30S ribosomal protein S20 [Armatimonadota bacterium]